MFPVFYIYACLISHRLKRVIVLKLHRELQAWLQDTFRTEGPHRSCFRITESKRVVLFLHGIQGSPSQFDWLMEALSDDTDYINVLLPGHGDTLAMFRRHGRHDWEENIQALLDHILPVYEQINLVGHSMGCLLWLSAYRQHPERFHSFLALSCPFALRPTLRYLRNNLLALYDLPMNNVYIQAARKANSLSSRNPFAYLFCLKPYSSLLSMIRSARKMDLQHVMNGFAYLGEKDEIVSPRSLHFASKMGFCTELLPLCGHNYFSPAAKRRIQENFLRMISQSK